MTALPTPLVDAAWLAAHLGSPDLRIVDCRFDLDDPSAGRRMHAAGHIPGAVYLSLDDDLSAIPGPGRHPLPNPATFAATIGSAGIGNDDAVVAYDSAGGEIASRLWWMLSSLGHERVAVLDGGWHAWSAAGGSVDDSEVEPAPAVYAAPARWAGIIGGTDLEERLGDVMLIDARAPERYRGDIEPLDPVAGHIPTAHNIPFADNLTSGGVFLDAASLAARYPNVDGDVVVYCGSGVTACHNLLAMQAAGLTGALLYPGSWSDWCTAGGEIALGPHPGEPTR